MNLLIELNEKRRLQIWRGPTGQTGWWGYSRRTMTTGWNRRQVRLGRWTAALDIAPVRRGGVVSMTTKAPKRFFGV